MLTEVLKTNKAVESLILPIVIVSGDTFHPVCESIHFFNLHCLDLSRLIIQTVKKAQTDGILVTCQVVNSSKTIRKLVMISEGILFQGDLKNSVTHTLVLNFINS